MSIYINDLIKDEIEAVLRKTEEKKFNNIEIHCALHNLYGMEGGYRVACACSSCKHRGECIRLLSLCECIA